MAAKHLFLLSVVAATITGLTVACDSAARHRVLSFFFDGVPKPGEATPVSTNEQKTDQTEVATEPSPADSTDPVIVAKTYFSHPPYKTFQCRRCHQPAGVELVATPQEGLCARCHADIPGDAAFVHGPVAVRDCLFCHHHHESAIPGMLLLPPDATCLRCHDRTDLTAVPQHAETDDHKCIDCHDPHAGNLRYFLKRAEP